MWQIIMALPFSWRQRALAKQRDPISASEFAKKISSEGGDAEAALEIYANLLDWVYFSEFTPYPDDSLGEVYGIAEEELDEELILALLQKMGLVPPSAEVLQSFGAIDTPIRVAQLVRQVRDLKESA